MPPLYGAQTVQPAETRVAPNCCCWTRRGLTVNFQFALRIAEEVLDWNSCLTIGLGEGVATALRRTGHGMGCE